MGDMHGKLRDLYCVKYMSICQLPQGKDHLNKICHRQISTLYVSLNNTYGPELITILYQFQKIPLGSLWKEQTCVIFFMRRFG